MHVIKKDKHEKMFKTSNIILHLLVTITWLSYCQSQQKVVIQRQLTGDVVSNIDCITFYGQLTTTGVCKCVKGSFFTSCLYSKEIKFHTGKY